VGTSDCFDRMATEGNYLLLSICVVLQRGFLRRTVPFPPLPDSVEGTEVGTGHQHWEHIQSGEAVVHHPWMEEVR
jgi:hypothetical protein